MIPLLLAAIAGQGLGGLALKYGAEFMSKMRTQEADEQTKKQTAVLDSIFGEKDMSTPEGQNAATMAMMRNPLTFNTGAQLYSDQLQAGRQVELENQRAQNQLAQMGYGASLQAFRDENLFGNEWEVMKANQQEEWRRLQAQLAAQREASAAGAGGLPKPISGYEWTPTGGQRPIAGTPDYIKSVGELRGAENAVADMNRMINLFDANEGPVTTGPVAQEFNRLHASAITALSLASNAGIINNEAERKRYEDSLLNPSEASWLTGDESQRKQYEELRDIFQRTLDVYKEKYQDYGLPLRDMEQLGYFTRVQ